LKHILIVDDEAMVRRLVSKTLVKEGYEVSQAANGQEAWQMIEQAHPDALITDIDMPRMNGEQLCTKITDEVPGRLFPIVVVTSKTALEHRTWAREMENVTFIEKPLSLKKLIEHVDRLLNSRMLVEEGSG